MYPVGYNACMPVKTTEVYYTERGGELIVLLAGGDKSTQSQDIKTAIALAKNL